MGLKEAGVPARDYGNNRPRIAVKLYEGNLTFSATGFGEDGRASGRWDVTAPMHIGQYVKLHPDSTPKDIIVQPAADSTEAIGKLVTNNKLIFDIDWTADDQNILPRENKSWGQYVPRGATCEFFGAAIDELKVVASNAAIGAGDYLKSVANEEFDKETTATNWIALAKIDALKGGFVPALAFK